MSDRDRLVRIIAEFVPHSAAYCIADLALAILNDGFKREDCCGKYINGAFNSIVRCAGGDWNQQEQFSIRRFIYCPECGGKL